MVIRIGCVISCRPLLGSNMKSHTKAYVWVFIHTSGTDLHCYCCFDYKAVFYKKGLYNIVNISISSN